MPLVEREHDIDLLRDALESGSGRRVALVTGVPGIGKTTLLRAVRERMTGGRIVLEATGSELGADVPYGALRQLLMPLVQQRSAGRAPFDGPGRGLHDLVRGGAVAADLDALVYAAHWVLSSLARPHGVLLVLDDLPWLDRASAEVLGRALALLTGDRVAVLAAARSTGGGLTEELRTLADAVVTPAALSVDGIAGLLVIDDAAAREVAALSGGLPLFVAELGAMLARGERPGLSSRMADDIGRRLERLPAAARELATALAVLGPDAAPATVRALADPDGSAADGIALDAAVDALVRSGLAAPRAGRPPVLHALVAEARLDELGPAGRALRHAQAARLLAQEGVDPGIVAAHLRRTRPSGSEEVARTLVEAGRIALAEGAAAESAALAERALAERTPLDADAAEALGSALVALDRPAEAARAWTTAAARRDAVADQARCLGRAGDAWFAAGDRTAAEDAYARALALLATGDGSGDDDRALDLVLRRAIALLAANPRADVVPVDRLARALAEPAGDDSPVRRRLFALAAMVRAVTGDRPAAAGLAVRAWADGAWVRDADPGDPLTPSLCAAFYLGGELDLAIAVADADVAGAAASGRLGAEATARACRGALRMVAGDLPGAAADLAIALRVPRLSPWVTRLSARTLAIRCALVDGDGELAAAIAAEPEPDGVTDAWRAAALVGAAELAVVAGDAEHAARLAAESARRDPVGGVAWTVSWRPAAAEAALALGDRRRAAELIAEEETVLAALGVPAAARVQLELVRSRLTDDALPLAAYRDALPSRHRWQHALLARRLAEVHETAGRHEEAAAERALAQAIAREQGLDGLGVRSGAPAGEGAPRALTAAERRVVDLVTTGLSNREIARRLYVTPKTVEFHLSRVYRKLDVRSRHELARALGRGPGGHATGSSSTP